MSNLFNLDFKFFWRAKLKVTLINSLQNLFIINDRIENIQKFIEVKILYTNFNAT